MVIKFLLLVVAIGMVYESFKVFPNTNYKIIIGWFLLLGLSSLL